MSSTIRPEEKHKITLIVIIYYYLAMLVCLLVFFGGTNLAAHGFLRATSDHTISTVTCLPPPAPRITDPSNISSAERKCRDAEQTIQVHQGSFQVAQGLTMAVLAVVIFAWHFRRVWSLELQLH